MGKKDKEQGLETFLKSEFLGELKNETPTGSVLLEKYPLKAPFSSLRSLRHINFTSLCNWAVASADLLAGQSSAAERRTRWPAGGSCCSCDRKYTPLPAIRSNFGICPRVAHTSCIPQHSYLSPSASRNLFAAARPDRQ